MNNPLPENVFLRTVTTRFCSFRYGLAKPFSHPSKSDRDRIRSEPVPSHKEHLMSEKKPEPMFVAPQIKICPVCGKQSYSREGIHPQCATVQADSARKEQLAAKRKAEADKG